MSQPMNTALAGYYQRLVAFPQQLQRRYIGSRQVSTSELLAHVREAKTTALLTKTVNSVQERLWKAPGVERAIIGEQLVNSLSTRVLHASSVEVRVAAAEWLRLLTQMGIVTHPKEMFVTLVTAATSVTRNNNQGAEEQHAYLKVLLDCFWPFRYPYPTFSWQQFPENTIFYPLAALLTTTSPKNQELLIAIFSELPALNDSEIAQPLLPIALAWSKHVEADHRSRITDVLAKLRSTEAYEALARLQMDDERAVCNSAKHAAYYVVTRLNRE